MKKTFVGVEKFSNEDLFSRVLASSSVYEVTKKKKERKNLIIVDSAKEPTHGDIVVAAINGEFTVKKLQLHPRLALIPMNPDYNPIYLDSLGDIDNNIIFGVVTHSIEKIS